MIAAGTFTGHGGVVPSPNLRPPTLAVDGNLLLITDS